MLSRRRLLRQLGVGGLGMICARCGDDPARLAALAERARAYDPALECSDLRGLFPVEVQTRVTNEYAQHSTRPDQFCFNCANFIAPAVRGGCATCKTVKGPINPLGWCRSWTAGKA
ncbi:MAG TPA: hypothetical protein VJS92_12730 [Candidatus Polarisedimenticolaceae bacterium]|nr:hypothetical protein [Candidatus Polarisedimenticolaceae bacterium]